MALNPYAPPQSTVVDVAADVDAGTLPFFPVSRLKLVVLSFCTFGFYQIYWFYMNWRSVRDNAKEKVLPFWRALFAVLFCYSLFDRVRKHSPETPSSKLPAGPLAAAWIIPTVLWRLPDPYWLITFLGIFALVPVQTAINTVNRSVAPDHDPNSRFTGWNWLGVVLGGPFFLLGVYGTFLPPQ